MMHITNRIKITIKNPLTKIKCKKHNKIRKKKL